MASQTHNRILLFSCQLVAGCWGSVLPSLNLIVLYFHVPEEGVTVSSLLLYNYIMQFLVNVWLNVILGNTYMLAFNPILGNKIHCS